MPNRREFDHIGAFNFNVEIEGVMAGPVLYVAGLTARTEVLRFKDGADVVTRQRPGRSHCDNLVIQRGYTGDNALFTWYEGTRDGRVERKAGSVILFGDDAQTEITRFNFFEAWPCRWTLQPLGGVADDPARVLAEEIEIAIERIERG